ncbi:LOW QUALITY PROTEIN: transmembrane protein 272 [Suricata suricatta]|uniref:LOW QUALITY PROTEIN: transmembrane protein 272 n=1 Tax=Suricata suricatta TaxID=37032 RepID=UPI001155C20D|nr:LOW QUALITY PROTEIN: transmembrane protein 272 [Suricata suricatta]
MTFLEDCPIQPLIPLYLLVGGVTGALKLTYIYLLFDSTRLRRLVATAEVMDDRDDDGCPWRLTVCGCYVHRSLGLFLFLWYILGTHRASSVHLPDFSPAFQQPLHQYCDKTLDLFAVGVILAVVVSTWGPEKKM